jgi:hypothetical protein
VPTKVTDEDRFDFQAWITDARPNVKQVTVYNRPDLVERVNELRATVERDAPSLSQSHRTYKAPPESAELKRLTEEMERSALTVVIKANNEEDVRTARAAAKDAGADPDDQEATAPFHLAQCIVDAYPGPERPFDYDAPHTTLTSSQVKSLRAAIREAQFTKLWLAMVAVSNRAPEPSPDFSQPSSPDPGTPTP